MPPAPAWMVKKQLRGSLGPSSSACSSTFSPRFFQVGQRADRPRPACRRRRLRRPARTARGHRRSPRSSASTGSIAALSGFQFRDDALGRFLVIPEAWSRPSSLRVLCGGAVWRASQRESRIAMIRDERFSIACEQVLVNQIGHEIRVAWERVGGKGKGGTEGRRDKVAQASPPVNRQLP